MIKNNKRLYYQYHDIVQLSKFLSDEKMTLRALSVQDVILRNFNKDLARFSEPELLSLGIDQVSVAEIVEFGLRGRINAFEQYARKVDEWIRNLILPGCADCLLLRNVICAHKMSGPKDLVAYFKSKRGMRDLGEETSELYAHYVTNMCPQNFYIEFRNASIKTPLIKSIGGRPILGNFHNHTDYSDGENTIADLAILAKDTSREYVGISDHSQKLKGVSQSDLIRQKDEILKVECPVRVVRGVECEILQDGSLDLSDECLSTLDFVIAAVHTDMFMVPSLAMKRVINAIENPSVRILAHPSARLYMKNAGLCLDLRKVIDACVKNRVAIEINGDPNRLDLSPDFLPYAVNRGAFFTIDSDTHNADGFVNINNAIQIAIRSGVPPELILNTYEFSEAMNLLS